MTDRALGPISCIVPVHNGERFLEAALQSVFDQDRAVDEVIVVDDGSTDGTGGILASFRSRIRVIRQEHRGVAAARNRGVEEATGALIAFQDADDLWAPHKTRLQLAMLEADPELDLCFGMIQNFWMEELAEEEEGYRGQPFAKALDGRLLQCMLAHKSAILRVGPFDPSLRVGSDTEWFLRAREAGLSEVAVPEVLLRRRLHQGNLTREDLASREQLLATMKASLDRRRQSG